MASRKAKTERSLPVPLQPSVEKGVLELFRTTLGKAQQTVAAWRGRLVLVYLPRYERYVPEVGRQPDRVDILAVVRSLGIPIVGLHPVFVTQDDPLQLFSFRLPTRYNSAGQSGRGGGIPSCPRSNEARFRRGANLGGTGQRR